MTNSPKCAAVFVTDWFLEVTKAALSFSSAVHTVLSIISEYTANPASDLTRDRKLPAEKLITFLVSQGASSSKNELLDFFDMDPQAPTASALSQQRQN